LWSRCASPHPPTLRRSHTVPLPTSACASRADISLRHFAASAPDGAMAAKTDTAASSSLAGALGELRHRYTQSQTPLLSLIDSFLVLAVVIAGVQFGYCAMVGTFPFNSFLSGFAAALGMFVLTGETARPPSLPHSLVTSPL